jgi:nicotinate-nucleotide adenylyltransferase
MNKVALFGGTFDPVHLGHTACLHHLVENMDFSKVVLVPTSQNPLKQDRAPASKEDRLKMIEIATEDLHGVITVDDYEVLKDSPSFSFDTLKRYQEFYQPEELYLVMGLDTFAELDQWKNYEEVIAMTNIVVVSRPPYRRPLGVEDLPSGLRPHVHSYERGFALLNSGRTIEFVNIKTEDISSTLVRKKLRTGKSIQSLIDINVEKYIKENNVYPCLTAGEVDFTQVTRAVASLLNERATNCAAYDLTELDKLYDFTIVASATSTKQALSLANIVKDQVKEDFGLSPFSIEGREEGRWVILDYGALIVHIFYDYVRQEYQLEELWRQGKKINFDEN